jgi:copper(I)-binding protein
VGRSRRWAVGAAAVVTLVPLSGCAAGIQAETSRERPTIDGIGSAIGTLTVRNTYVGGPVEAGGTAPVLASVFNNGNEPDRLVSISSPEAGGGAVPADTALPPGGQQLFYAPDRVLRLTGITEPMRPGNIVPITLQFERAGTLQMSVPVSPVAPEVLAATAGSGSASPSASASPSGSAAPSASPGAPSASPSASASAGAPPASPSAGPSITP